MWTLRYLLQIFITASSFFETATFPRQGAASSPQTAASSLPIATSSQLTTTVPRSLLGFPCEIWQIIFMRLLVPDSDICSGDKHRNLYTMCGEKYANSAGLSIFHVPKAVYNETVDIFYKRNAFRIGASWPSNIYLFFRSCGDGMLFKFRHFLITFFKQGRRFGTLVR